jgi:eukaryotic-like serine/threonine-protein kinase
MIDPNAVTSDGGPMLVGVSGIPAQIGPYRIIELLGQGGMGRVLLGESSVPKRKAAIKLLLGETLSSDMFARFRREMDALAKLEHPNIARLFEAGSLTQADRIEPWYAMEFVDGMPLDAYVNQHKLEPPAVLRLVAHIARALHYAHQRGVIHRDIKPANILVNKEGVPKLLDFGIARLIDDDGSSVRTRFGQIIGTLAYMSPEQLSSAAHADVRSDVYALGVVLYELLSGGLPLKISTTSLLDAIRDLAEGKRVPLSERKPAMRGELELIVDTASHRDLNQRYDSAASFANDLDNFLLLRPLSARRASVGYLAQKFIRRHPALVAGIALMLLTLIGATAISLVSAKQARIAQRQAEASAAQLLAVNRFMREMLEQADPSNPAGGSPTMRDALIGADAAFAALPADPELRSAVAELLAAAWNGSGDHERALQYAEQAITALKTLRHEDDESVLALERARIIALNELGKYDLALASIDRLLTLASAKYGADAMPVLKLKSEKMVTLSYLQRAPEGVAIGEALLRDHTPEFAALGGFELSSLRRNTALLMRQTGRLKEALAIHQQSWNAALAAGTSRHPKSLFDLHSMAMSQGRLGQLEQALNNFREAARLRTEVLGDRHPATINSELSVVGVLGQLNRPAEAIKIAEAVLPRAKAVMGETHMAYLGGLNNYGLALEASDNVAAAEAAFTQAISMSEAAAGITPNSLRFRGNLAKLWIATKRLPEARDAYAVILKAATEKLTPTDLALAEYRATAGQLALLQARKPDAVQLLELAIVEMEKQLPADDKALAKTREFLRQALH